MGSQTNTYRVLVGFDFTELGLLALQGGVRQVSSIAGAELHVVGVVKTDGVKADRIRQQIQDHVQEDLEKAKIEHVKVFAHTRIGAPAKEICSLADEQNIDLIVVGTHGRHGFKRLVQGSVAEHVVRDAPCPVLVMRPKSTTAEAYQPEPPCAQCVAVREASNGAEMWCEVHKQLDSHLHSGKIRHTSSGSWTTYNH
jgi:nucleotide-binding universal stress UspA family protein